MYNRLAAQGGCRAGRAPQWAWPASPWAAGWGAVRAYGLTCDNLESLQIVTAPGQLLTCDATQNRSLYWASRGGGGGN